MLLLAGLISILAMRGLGASNNTGSLFGYQEIYKDDLTMFPQWLSVLARHIEEITPHGSCDSIQFNRCHLQMWQDFLREISQLPRDEQIRRVNLYANEKPYVLDIENYGVLDYWATPGEFLENNGDCEDYAIFKMLSLKYLGFAIKDMRVVVVQDTNLKIPHAILALNQDNDILILDNQIKQVISHRNIFHYVPVYSLNEHNWWMHLPN